MNLSINPLALVLFATGFATIIMGLIIYSRLKPNERSFSFVLCLAGFWAMGYGAELSSLTVSTMLFWLRFQYIAICFLPPALLIFIRVFISNQKISPKPFHALIFVVPIVTIFFVWTNNLLPFYYKSLAIDSRGSFPVLKIDPAFWYYVFTAYWYLTVIWAIYSLTTAFKHADKIYQKQKNIILYALIVPWIGNIVYKYGIHHNQNIDLTPFAFIVTAIIISYGLLKYKLLDVLPAAREKVFETMQDGVLVLDKKGKVIDKNMRMEKILLHHEGVMAADLQKLFPGNEKLQLSVAERKKVTLEINHPENGVDTYYEVNINVLLDKTSDYNGSILIFHDVTQRKKDELSLLALNKLKDRLLSIIAHDLRSPLHNITDMVRMIDEQLISEEEFKMFLPELSKNLNYTSNLLDNLLHWSKSQLRGEVTKNSTVDIRDLVEHEIIYYEQKAAEKGVKLNQTIKDEILVDVDPEMIQLVIRNLIGNAIKFCSSGDNISVSSIYNRSKEAVICIKDTGSGMKSETVEKLFMPDTFTRRGTNNEQGIGLGLQLCKDFVEKNKGRIWVNTEWGKGSEFYFSVPAA